MGYHPRIEAPELANFLTTRTVESRLWFINNPALEQKILGHTARIAQRYQVKLYALAIEGNHIQGPALFPEGNRASFMRDLNSAIAREVPRSTSHPGGRLWARRYSNEFLPGPEDVEEYFFYTVLQAVQDGLVERISDSPGYNCFHDAVWGIKKRFKVVRWAEYHAALRRGENPRLKDYLETVVLEYERLPGYEELPQAEYARLMMEKLEERRAEIVRERHERGLGFAGKANLERTRAGALPKSTKTSTIESHRPRILCVCPKRREAAQAWYFDMYFQYKAASEEYRSGKKRVEFPPGTYPPCLPAKLS